MSQYGFFIDTSRCTGCNACVIACKQWRDVDPGPAKPIRVYQWEKGDFPDVDVRVLPIMCFHCKNPKCMDACENKAIYKEEKYGAVLVDESKCTGDRKCFDACPYGTPQYLSDAEDEKMLKCDMCIDRLEEGKTPLCVLSCSLRALDFGPLEELYEKYGDTGSYIAEDESPCHNACPGGLDIQKYMNQTAEGKYEEAMETCQEVTPFAGVLGRVCTRPCEIDCFRGRFDDAVAIRETKRFFSDYCSENNCVPEVTCADEIGKTVAIIGGGPAGLSCAYSLARKGYNVTVFDREKEMGGKMRYGIPEYRLAREVLRREIDVIKNLGVKMENEKMLTDISELDSFDAVFLATGAGEGIPLNVPGADSKGISTALDFLHDVNAGKTDRIDDDVVVIGGGSVALDAARTAVRLGATNVHLVCLESADYKDKDPMPGQEEEVTHAKEEGIIIHDKFGVHSFSSENGNVSGVSCVDCLSVKDEIGRFSPCYANGDPTLKIKAGMVLLALGQRVASDACPDGTPLNSNGRVDLDGNFLTSDSRIFAGGDVITGMIDIISAVAAGNEAAESIDRSLNDESINGKAIDEERRVIPISARPRLEKKSPVCANRAASERSKDFDEVTLGFDNGTCAEQSDRCLHCGSMVPSAVIRREMPKKNILPWDKWEALALWTVRHPDNGEELPDVIENIEEVIDPSDPPIFCRGKLNLKARYSEEKLLSTMDDE